MVVLILMLLFLFDMMVRSRCGCTDTNLAISFLRCLYEGLMMFY